MTSKERVFKAFAGEKVDRIPWVPFCGVHSAALLGMDATTFLQDAQAIVRGQKRAAELYRPDGLPVTFDLQVEAEVLGCELRWAADNPPAVATHPLAGGEKHLDDLALPARDSGRIPVVLEAARELRSALPDLALYGLVTGPFTLALHLLGTDIFLKMFDTPEEVAALLEFTRETAIRMAEYYIEAGCDIIAVVDPMTSQIGPEQFRQFCTPYVTPVFDAVHAKDRLASFFVCGHAQQNIEEMCRCHCDNVSIDENIPLDYVKDICREHGVSFGGNLQLTVVLLTGTPEDCQRNAVECMEIGGDRGFILAPGCDLPYATPPENLQAVAEVVYDEYQRQVVRELAKNQAACEIDVDMSEYGTGDKVIVDIITLDSEACAPCQYMVESVRKIAPEFDGIVVWREHKIKYRESIAFMSALMVRNIPTICIDGRITFVSRIPRREELIAAIQKRINEKLRLRIQSQSKRIRVFGPPTEACLEVRRNVRKAIEELGADVTYEEIEDEEACRRFGVFETPAVAVARQWLKSSGTVPPVILVKEWLKQLDG